MIVKCGILCINKNSDFEGNRKRSGISSLCFLQSDCDPPECLILFSKVYVFRSNYLQTRTINIERSSFSSCDDSQLILATSYIRNPDVLINFLDCVLLCNFYY